ncbi:DUF4139 domain-containing protein [Streptomyces sp. NPDC005423]|uniref:DUF4139 domain-containing protein n=1 Tax=Streptomyces sp. NPDC005423 TaxID=3155343 RepID=UPI0033A23A43
MTDTTTAIIEQDPAAEPLPVTAVTCMEDRAQVERRARVTLRAGTRRLRLGPVTPLAVDRSLRVDITAAGTGGATGARVIDARVVRRYTPAPPGGTGVDVSRLRRAVDALEHEVRDARLLRRRLESRLAVVAQAKTDLYRDISESAGAGDADPDRWADRLERVGSVADASRRELRALNRRHRDLEAELASAQRALVDTEREPQELTAVFEVVVEAEQAGPALLHVTHLVPCALWRPAYRATLAADGRSVRLESDAVVWQRTGEDWADVRLSFSTARPTLAANPPALRDDVLVLRDRSAEERRTVEVDLREEEIHTVGADSEPVPGRAGDLGELPGLHDGGEVRVLAAPAPVGVAGDGRPHRVHLGTFTAECRAELTCAPELSPLVALVARVPNLSGHVLLAGPVDVVRESGFVGRGQLPFAGSGEEVRLAFGTEDTYRVVRHVEETRTSAGLSGLNHRTVITRRVRIFVSRLDARTDGPASVLEVCERVPVSEVAAVEVLLRGESARPEPGRGPDSEGIVRHRLELTPGGRREIELEYEIRAPDTVVGL